MKRTKKTALALALAMLLTLLAGGMAESGLQAWLEGNVLVVSWQTGCSGGCVLEVYQNGWPVATKNVDSSRGTAGFALGTATGKYTVRLKTAQGCMATDVSSKTPSITISPTPSPTARPSAGPAAKATPKPIPTPLPQTGADRSGLAGQVVEQVNAERAKYGLSALRVDAELTRAAAVRAREIAQTFSHTRPDGTAWSTVSKSVLGENIARGQKTADKVMAAWLTSEGHRANILRPGFGSIGVCALVVDGVTCWVQLFGK